MDPFSFFSFLCLSLHIFVRLFIDTYACMYIKSFHNCSEATMIEGRNVVMVPLKVTIAGKEKIFHGFGANKKLAKCAAAKQALKRLRGPK